ncbi:MAG: flagellar hook-length control protein FliK, partial [Geminicoccaceae bacterium]
TDPNRQAGSDLADGKPVRSTVSAIESGGKAAGTIANANHLAHPQMVEPNLPQSVGSTGVERIQPALPLDGAIDGIERFEPTSNLAPSKLAASTAQPTPGAQVALQIVRSLPNGVDRFTVHLQPAELGSVDIRLEFEGAGRMNAVITAERPETLELLQRDSRILERSLGDSGLKLASDGLSFALKQDQQQQQQGQSFHEQAQARETAFRAGRAYDDTPELEPMPSTMQVDRLRLLDIRT